VAWYGVARRGVARRGVAWRGAAWRGSARRGVARRGLIFGLSSVKIISILIFHDLQLLRGPYSV
jgi:hypothetical protein